ncbi:LodA/GoxA family CTQ-dependent oxidase [Chromobacterium sp. IIBBL 290-4]|uniref:LodA/GoxA family CTQ-dependent oxidase n=1 Tax=Chromobacterium sp. IIBBL 290-4 TaxID=2953890 RepID=UPI0020B71508|nr:LodA/GoxA family CTQ-dependent oxidase [Chromobacterium sp. IIBBL 290-4]UTH75175.1 LodA/GoxA family CTQ-dependent oxidase [Chromobacterium sp. IIBBL 290-4]
MSDYILRVHPAINIARIGSSDEFYIAPETPAGESLPDSDLLGGLPIKAGTENTPIDESDFRDAKGLVKRQAARFRIFAYPADSQSLNQYPMGPQIKPIEVVLGARLGNRVVKDIVWTVHVANKKLNNFAIGDDGLDGYLDPATVPLRNGYYPNLPPNFPVLPTTNGSPYWREIMNNIKRCADLVIDPGPRSISALQNQGKAKAFSKHERACFADSQGGIQYLDYPQSFPQDAHPYLEQPLGAIDSLGELRVDAQGRLLVTGGFGHTAGVKLSATGMPPPLKYSTENGLWFDDASDGPVNAIVIFEDGSQEAHGAWVVTGDPGYAPQIRNVVSAWDDIFDMWVRELDLMPCLYRDQAYDHAEYQPSFRHQVQPIFQAAMLQRWGTNLPNHVVNAHDSIGAIQPTTDPRAIIPDLEKLIRNPEGTAQELQTGRPLMPLSLGDARKSFLTVTRTQYFFLQRWHQQQCSTEETMSLGEGEKLDYAALANCLGGRYSPGIEVSFPVRDPNLYIRNWRERGCGPFRINQARINYANIDSSQPVLRCGYVPLQKVPVDKGTVEPGDVSKFMSVPWHTDYNSCAVHLPNPNPINVDGNGTPYPNNVLFWSWPAQRPVQVFPKSSCDYDPETGTWILGNQVFSIRGAGTETEYPATAGRFQSYADYMQQWNKTGFVIQGLQIPAAEKANYGPRLFLEVSSQMDPEAGPPVQPFPTASVPPEEKA